MKTHAPHRSRRRLSLHSSRGFTLTEMLIAMTLAALVLARTTGAIMALVKGSQSLVNYSEMNTESRFALENLGRNLRSANSVKAVANDGFRITRVRSDGTQEDLRYDYDAQARTLALSNLTSGENRVLLHDVNSLTLNYYKLRSSSGAGAAAEPTSSPLEVKHVQLEAELRRDVLNLANRNYIISARFMLRNHRVSN